MVNKNKWHELGRIWREMKGGERMYKSKESEERNRIAGEIMEILKKEHLTVGTAIIILESVRSSLGRFANGREIS